MSQELAIMKLVKGPIDLSKLKKTNKRNQYTTPYALSPLVYYDGYSLQDLFPIPNVSETIPDYYEGITRMATRIRKWIKQDKWQNYFENLDVRIGFTKYIEFFDKIPDDQKYDCFIIIYQRSEFGFEMLKDHYLKILSFSRYSRLRHENLQTLFLKTDPKFTIYHGESTSYPVYDHYSWTLSKTVAEFFAYRYNGEGEVWKLEVDQSDNRIIDYLTNRSEEEIIYAYEPGRDTDIDILEERN